MKKNDKIFLIVFLGIVTFSLLYLFQASYAKYRRQLNANVEARVASWNIKVNNETIINKTTLTNNIVPVIDANTYVKDNVIAPGSTGYFDVIINAEEVDVDFTYTLTSDVAEETPLLDLEFTKYKVNGVEYNYTTEDTITGELTKNTGDVNIRIYFKWNDDPTNQMNNQQDTEYAADENHANTSMKVMINFAQKNSA